MFDYLEQLDELRTYTTEWLVARRTELIREQRRLHVEELAVTAVLDERGAIDDSLAAVDGVSVRSVRETLQTARALEDLPGVAAAAFDGRLSDEQLAPLARLADPSSDAEWAQRAPNTAPADLARLARSQVTPTMDEARARRAARSLGFWWRTDAGRLDGRFSIPDLDGDLVERVFNHMIDQMQPPKGQLWETRARRGADALVQLCRDYVDDHAVATPNVVMVVEVPQHGPVTVAGIPLPDEMVQSLRAQAKIDPVLVDEQRVPIAVGKARSPLSAKTLRAVRLRDGHCRGPGVIGGRGCRCITCGR
jgi:hypothetical protein